LHSLQHAHLWILLQQLFDFIASLSSSLSLKEPKEVARLWRIRSLWYLDHEHPCLELGVHLLLHFNSLLTILGNWRSENLDWKTGLCRGLPEHSATCNDHNSRLACLWLRVCALHL